MQLLIPFPWGTPTAKTHITCCSVAVVRFQPVFSEQRSNKKALSNRNSLWVCKYPAWSWQKFGLRARYPSFVRSTNVSETRDVCFCRRRRHMQSCTLLEGYTLLILHISCTHAAVMQCHHAASAQWPKSSLPFFGHGPWEAQKPESQHKAHLDQNGRLSES